MGMTRDMGLDEQTQILAGVILKEVYFMRPIIGITCGQDTSKTGSKRCYQNTSYIESITLARGVPLLIPLTQDVEALRALFEAIDGLLLTGGGDVEPQRYEQQPHPKLGATDALRDRVELTLAQWAFAADTPTLGICRGIQTLNIALGGSLFQDIASQIEGTLVHPHQDGNPRSYLAHNAQVARGTLLDKLVPTADGVLAVNSMHHQAVQRPASGFTVSALAPDGVIEAIEHPGRRFMLGVQWHPEEMVFTRPQMRGLFEGFVQSAGVRRDLSTKL